MLWVSFTYMHFHWLRFSSTNCSLSLTSVSVFGVQATEPWLLVGQRVLTTMKTAASCHAYYFPLFCSSIKTIHQKLPDELH